MAKKYWDIIPPTKVKKPKNTSIDFDDMLRKLLGKPPQYYNVPYIIKQPNDDIPCLIKEFFSNPLNRGKGALISCPCPNCTVIC